MKKKTILVSAIAGDIGCSAVRSLSDAGYTIIGCDMKSYSPVSDVVQKQYKAPAASYTKEYIDFIKEVVRKEDVNFFLPISEPEIEVLNNRREELEILGVKLLLNNKIILDNFLDKLKTVRYLEKLAIKVPKTMPLNAYDGSFDYPFIVKSVKGCGSKRLWLIESPKDLDYHLQKDDGSLIAQEYIGSDEGDFTTGIFSDGKRISTITFKRKLGYGGLSVEAILTEEPYLEMLALRIARETGLVGSINLQSRKVGEIFMPYEINPRLSSTLLFRKKFGFDDAVWWVQAIEDEGYLHTYERKYRAGIALRGFTEHYFDLEEA